MNECIKALGSIPDHLTKAELEELGTVDAEQLATNSTDLRQTYLDIRRYQAYLDTISNALRQTITEEQDNEPFESGNATIRYQKRVSYSYADDPQLVRLKVEGNEIKAFLKSHQTFLQSIQGEFEDVADEDTGEVIRYHAPERTETQVMMVRL